MKTLIIYDNQGYIISAISGIPSPRKPVGVPYLEVDIPEGKRIKIDENGIGVDVTKTPHEVILEDIPPTEVDTLKTEVDTLKKQVADLTYQLMIKGVL